MSPRKKNEPQPPPMIDPHGEADDVITDVPELSVEEVEKRIGAREQARRRRVAATPARIRTAPSNRRAILWRDSATILVFVVIALLSARFLLGNGQSGIATASPTLEPTGNEITEPPLDTGFHFSLVPTIGPPVDPSNRINATPTPIPVITLGPATPRPSKTPPTKTLPPGQTPTPVPTAPPVAAFSATCTGPNAADFTAGASTAGTGATITSYDWAWDDGTGDTTATATTSHAFATSGDHNVILTIHNSTGGHDAITHVVNCP